MTNKEVIEQLKGIRSDYERDCKHSLFKEMLYRKDIEALNIAIKALEERQQGEWKPLPLKTLNGDDIVAYESSCCGAVADKKYTHCPKCDAYMKGGEV